MLNVLLTFCFSLFALIIIIVGYCQPEPVQGLRPDGVLTAWATQSSLGVHLSRMYLTCLTNLRRPGPRSIRPLLGTIY